MSLANGQAVIIGDSLNPSNNGIEVHVVGEREPMPWRSDRVSETQYGYRCRFPDGTEKVVWEKQLVKMGGGV